ncbi:hypothetical protein [Flavobacterium columnare]|uniref:hypothetical protein n=1 Tax=Flavobacterium columnare TaxID=996 RepID=UPI003BA2B113
MDLKDVGYIVGIVGTAIATFLTTKHNLKEYVRDKTDELKDKIHKQELELEKLKGRDENQQQIINLFQSQILDHLPKIYDLINTQKKIK